jgi:FlaG/FlaF family flagellin (archaellin)
MLNNRLHKKGLAPLIAVMLLLIVAVVAGVTLQTWYTEFTSKSLAQAEASTSESITLTKIMDNINGTIYFRNGYNSDISITDVFIGNKSCSITATATVGMNEIPLGNCSQNLTSYRDELKIYTDKGVFTKFLYFS